MLVPVMLDDVLHHAEPQLLMSTEQLIMFARAVPLTAPLAIMTPLKLIMSNASQLIKASSLVPIVPHHALPTLIRVLAQQWVHVKLDSTGLTLALVSPAKPSPLVVCHALPEPVDVPLASQAAHSPKMQSAYQIALEILELSQIPLITLAKIAWQTAFNV